MKSIPQKIKRGGQHRLDPPWIRFWAGLKRPTLTIVWEGEGGRAREYSGKCRQHQFGGDTLEHLRVSYPVFVLHGEKRYINRSISS